MTVADVVALSGVSRAGFYQQRRSSTGPPPTGPEDPFRRSDSRVSVTIKSQTSVPTAHSYSDSLTPRTSTRPPSPNRRSWAAVTALPVAADAATASPMESDRTWPRTPSPPDPVGLSVPVLLAPDISAVEDAYRPEPIPHPLRLSPTLARHAADPNRSHRVWVGSAASKGLRALCGAKWLRRLNPGLCP